MVYTCKSVSHLTLSLDWNETIFYSYAGKCAIFNFSKPNVIAFSTVKRFELITSENAM